MEDAYLSYLAIHQHGSLKSKALFIQSANIGRLESVYRAPEISGAQFRPNVARARAILEKLSRARAIWRNCPARAM